jgi:hypothetical protein
MHRIVARADGGEAAGDAESQGNAQKNCRDTSPVIVDNSWRPRNENSQLATNRGMWALEYPPHNKPDEPKRQCSKHRSYPAQAS